MIGTIDVSAAIDKKNFFLHSKDLRLNKRFQSAATLYLYCIPPARAPDFIPLVVAQKSHERKNQEWCRIILQRQKHKKQRPQAECLRPQNNYHSYMLLMSLSARTHP